jgi:hypothetical protein
MAPRGEPKSSDDIYCFSEFVAGHCNSNFRVIMIKGDVSQPPALKDRRKNPDVDRMRLRSFAFPPTPSILSCHEIFAAPRLLMNCPKIQTMMMANAGLPILLSIITIFFIKRGHT